MLVRAGKLLAIKYENFINQERKMKNFLPFLLIDKSSFFYRNDIE
jgi:hypothetical protein